MAISGEFEINQDLQFQRRMWKAERIGWIAMAVLLAGALLGLFGNGPMSWITTSNDSLIVEYQRFGRQQSALQLRVYLRAGLSNKDNLFFELNRAFVANVQVMRITPKPDVEQPISGGIRLIWSSNAEDGSMLVTISYQPEHIGWLTPSLSVGDADSLSIRQFIYP